MMGSLVFDKCYPTVGAAADAFFSARGPVLTSGATSYLTWFEKVGADWHINRQSISETGVVTNLASSIATVPAFPECDASLSFNDGRDVGWLLVGLMIVAWCLLILRRQVR
jgi:hypothetical protein